ncbi:hypothetical protein BD408DRAFT_427974 [Parasitella parasitica]|nr:hypothetical protein BD408DRAFT_427974 [Parasitella parasitica]
MSSIDTSFLNPIFKEFVAKYPEAIDFDTFTALDIRSRPDGSIPEDIKAPLFAVEFNCVVLFVNYSLGPEVKFPAALNECYSVVEYATNRNTSAILQIDPTRVVVGGDSTG